VSSGLATYPEDEVIIHALKNSAKEVYGIDATKQAVEIGNVKTMNVVLLGTLTLFLDIKAETWEKAINKFVPEKLREINLNAFYVGRKIMKAKEMQ
jgi:indolepyruvate ferredoxin oxidoreductase beta subunit